MPIKNRPPYRDIILSREVSAQFKSTAEVSLISQKEAIYPSYTPLHVFRRIGIKAVGEAHVGVRGVCTLAFVTHGIIYRHGGFLIGNNIVAVI